MKYAILVGDGMADVPISELGNKTPLEYASTPFMDQLASQGQVGRVSTVPQGLHPGSDVANLSLMGYDPLKYYSGRAPIEAASLGIQLLPDDTAFRCNLVTIKNNIMADYSAGHIETQDAYLLIEELQKKLGSKTVNFYPGISYRHILVLKNFPADLKCVPPHDISDHDISAHLPKGSGEALINGLMNQAREILSDCNSNKVKTLNNQMPATDIWLWGQGHALTLPKLPDRFGIQGSVISAVDLVRGLGVLAGLRVRLVNGATGYLGTNYSGKVSAAQASLADEDFVYLHVEAPDETSHQGSLQKKIQAIEEFDKHVVGEMLKYQKQTGTLRILVAPDHATPIALKTHTSEPVPFALAGPGIQPDTCNFYSEKIPSETRYTGPELFNYFIKGCLS